MIKTARKLLNILYIVHFAPCLSLRRFGSGTEARHTRTHTGLHIFAYDSFHICLYSTENETLESGTKRGRSTFPIKEFLRRRRDASKRFRSSFRIVLILSFAHKPFTVTGVVKRFIESRTFDSLCFKEALFVETFTIESRKQVPGKRLRLF